MHRTFGTHSLGAKSLLSTGADIRLMSGAVSSRHPKVLLIVGAASLQNGGMPTPSQT